MDRVCVYINLLLILGAARSFGTVGPSLVSRSPVHHTQRGQSSLACLKALYVEFIACWLRAWLSGQANAVRWGEQYAQGRVH